MAATKKAIDWVKRAQSFAPRLEAARDETERADLDHSGCRQSHWTGDGCPATGRIHARVPLGIPSSILALLMLVGTLPSAASAHAPGVVLSGSGTATIDGVMSPGEWGSAASANFPANLPQADGGGTSPATLFVMNDSDNLYLAVKVDRSQLNIGQLGFSFDSVSFEFDNNHGGSTTEEGDDVLVFSAGRLGFLDEVRTSRTCPATVASFCGLLDTQVGGTNDGEGAATNNGSFSFFEISHPLNSADDLNDFSLGAGSKLGFTLVLGLSSVMPACAGASCLAKTPFPVGPGGLSVGGGDIVIALDTTITNIPAPDSLTNRGSATFIFTGTDNLTRPGNVSFTCSLDGGAFEPCASPKEYTGLREGLHTFAVRARDAAGNVDPTPAQYSWAVDLTPPETTITDVESSESLGSDEEPIVDE